MSRARDPKRAKPRSSLQRLQSLANWNIHFRLHKLNYNDLAGFIKTDELMDAYAAHCKATKNLQKEIGKSYQITRLHILRERKKRQSS